jgi:2-methylcitrate dehydratase
MTTLSRQLAEYGLGLKIKDLPPEVIKQVKTLALDTIGCAFGGYPSPASTIVLKTLPELGGPPESTVIGNAGKTSCLNACMANGVMVRFLDYNDVYAAPGPILSGGHPSEVMPSIFAVGERQHSTGEQVIEAIVAAYELSARFINACTVKLSLELKGWNNDLRAGMIMPPAIGKLLGLNAEQIENAIGTTSSLNMVLGILDASKEEYTMTKNLRFPLTARDAVLACLLAQKGFTGPKRVIEGSKGFIESVVQGDFDLDKFTDFKGFYIMETGIKPFTADATTHGHLTATLELVKEHDIKPQDVAQIRIWATPRDAEHTGQPAKRYPTNKETADHSSYYLTARAIIDREIGPRQFTDEKYADPLARELNDKVISFEGLDELAEYFSAGISEIITKQGQTYKKEVLYPKGHYRNPMTDQEVEDKFRSMASVYMGESQMKEIIDTINNMDKLKDISDLTKLFQFKG